MEFTAENPKALIDRLEVRGFKEALLIGGEQINTTFFQAKLINEVWLTIEPSIFGLGNNVVLEKELNVDLKLLNIEKLNEKGTVLLKYKVMACALKSSQKNSG